MNRLLLPLAAAFGAVWPLFFDTAFKGSALLVLAIAVALLLTRASAATRHLVWLVAVIALLLVPVLSICLPQWRVLPAWATAAAIARKVDATTTPEILPRSTPARVTEYAPGENIGWPGANQETPSGSAPSSVHLPSLPPAAKASFGASAQASQWRTWLPLVWTVGFAACALRLATAYWFLRRKSAACAEIVDGPLFDALEAAKAQIGVTQRMRLLLDPRRTIPIVWGVFRPTLVLPAEAGHWEARQLRSVLLHELAHVRRRDIASQWLTQISCALHWFNPLVWLAAWRMHTERERACDDLVLTSGVRASDYAEHLLHVATKLQGSTWTSACGLAMARPSRLEGRLIAVLSDHLNRRRVTLALTVAALTLGALVAIPLSMLRAADAQAGEWSFPQGAHVSTNTRSSYSVSEKAQSAFVFFHPGPLNVEASNTSNAQTRTWTDRGILKTNEGKAPVTFLREHTAPEKLTVNGRPYDLNEGRVFWIAPDAAIRQLALHPPVVRDQAALEQLEKQVQAALPKEPQTRGKADEAPAILSVKGGNQRLAITVQTHTPGNFLFRVGDARSPVLFGMSFWPGEGETTRDYDLQLAPGDEPYGDRLRIGRTGSLPLRLPELPKGWLPEGRCEWRATPTTEGDRRGARFVFADVVTPDGRKLPLSVEYAGQKMPDNIPTFASTVQVEAAFRLFALPAGTPVKMGTAAKNEADKLAASAQETLQAPKVTTMPGNRAIIEIIREYRYPIAPGEYETDNLGTTCEIEPEATADGVNFRATFGLAVLEQKHPSLAVALENAMKGKIPDGSKIRHVKVSSEGTLKEGETLVLPLTAPDVFPDTAVVAIEAKQLPRPRARWVPKAQRGQALLQVESWPLVVPAASREAFLKIVTLERGTLEPDFQPEDGGATPMGEEQWAELQRAAGTGALQLGKRTSSIINEGRSQVLDSPAGQLEITPVWGNSIVDLSIVASPSGAPLRANKALQISVPPASPVILWLPRNEGQPSRGFILKVRQSEPPKEPEKPKAAARAQRLEAVTTTTDSAEILLDRGQGSLAFIVGDGESARTIVHSFGESQDPIALRVTADDRKGEWWNEVKIVRHGEGTALLPVLPIDWLPRGRVIFTSPAVREAADAFLIGEIVSETGRVPVRVRIASPAVAEQGSMRIIPQTYPEKEVILDTRLHALTEKAPLKPVILPVMAAQDLVGVPRSALAFPYITFRPGLSGRISRLQGNAETLQARTILTDRGLRVEGELTVGFPQDSYASAKEAWASFNSDESARPVVKTLRVAVNDTLGSNDALVVPIDGQATFPEKLVWYVTARTRQVPRSEWMPPAARPPILVDGWVLTWPAAEQEWFASNFDYDGIPSMLRHHLERRANPPRNSLTSETVGTMKQPEVEQLLNAFRKKEGVKIDRVEQFSAPLMNSLVSGNLDRTPFRAGGEEGSLLLSADADTISPNLIWARPVNTRLNAPGGYAIYSGTSLCALLPGPANPTEIRLLVLRCVDPSKKPAAAQSAPVPKENKAPSPPVPVAPPAPNSGPQTAPAAPAAPAASAASERPKWSAEGRVTDAAGQPIAEVEIWVHAGMGSLFRTGLAKTDATGRYRVEFTPGGYGSSPNLQVAMITAHRPGFFEKNLNCHGHGAMANADVSDAHLQDFGIARTALALPGKAREVNFVMLPAARIKGRLLGTGDFSNLSPEERRKNPEVVAGSTKLDGAGLAHWSIWLRGKDMPPGSSVLCTAKTDAEGNFEMTDVPMGYEWVFLADTNRPGARDPLSPKFRVTQAGEASVVLAMEEKQDAVRFVENKGLE